MHKAHLVFAYKNQAVTSAVAAHIGGWASRRAANAHNLIPASPQEPATAAAFPRHTLHSHSDGIQGSAAYQQLAVARIEGLDTPPGPKTNNKTTLLRIVNHCQLQLQNAQCLTAMLT